MQLIWLEGIAGVHGGKGGSWLSGSRKGGNSGSQDEQFCVSTFMWPENQHQCLELATEQNRLWYIAYKCHVVKLFAFFYYCTCPKRRRLTCGLNLLIYFLKKIKTLDWMLGYNQMTFVRIYYNDTFCITLASLNMFRDVLQDFYLLSWLIKNALFVWVSSCFTDSLGFILPPWLNHWIWDWTKSPPVFADSCWSARRYRSDYVVKSEQISRICSFWISFVPTQADREQLMERIWPVLCCL